METVETILINLSQEFKRGSAVLAVLLMSGHETYGYSMVRSLQAAGMDIEQNTLYPLLRRLETQGLLESVWDTAESRPRKYYRITPVGEKIKKQLKENWRTMVSAMEALMSNEENRHENH